MTSATIYLVRHAKAEERRSWNGDDGARPLSSAGLTQSESIGKRLVDHGATSAVSSPALRCVQTLEPLAQLLGRCVTPDDRLLEGAPFEGVLDLIADAPAGTALCTHGDIIPAAIQALIRRGMDVQTPSDWRKSAVWVLDRNATRITGGTVWPPPGKDPVR